MVQAFNFISSYPLDEVYSKAQSNGAIITREIETRKWGERAFNAINLDRYNLMFAQQVNK